MIRRKMTMRTASGRTTIDVNYCTAFSIREVNKKGVLSKAKYELDIHMQSGTIFTAEADDKELLVFTTLWETKHEHNLSVIELKEELE
jgi:hypothetical protein|tara:strand:- start:77 stop:340 length:264 start_codon:yes stop_codon:yes gene_type:complete